MSIAAIVTLSVMLIQSVARPQKRLALQPHQLIRWRIKKRPAAFLLSYLISTLPNSVVFLR